MTLKAKGCPLVWAASSLYATQSVSQVSLEKGLKSESLASFHWPPSHPRSARFTPRASHVHTGAALPAVWPQAGTLLAEFLFILIFIFLSMT